MKNKIINYFKKKFCFHDWIIVKNMSEPFLSPDDHVFYQCQKCGVYKETEKDYGYGVELDYINKYYYDDKKYLEIIMEELIK